MERTGPKRRKPIRDQGLEEIKDNIINNKKIAHEKTQKMTEHNNDSVSSNYSESFTTDDEIDNNSKTRVSPRNINKLKQVEEKTRTLRNRSTLDENKSNTDSSSLGIETHLHLRKESSNKILQGKKVPSSKRFKSQNETFNSTNEKNSNIKIFSLIIAFIVIAAAFFFFRNIDQYNLYEFNFFLQENTKTDSEDTVLANVAETLKNLRSKYKNQNKELWQKAYFGITNLIREQNKKPSIILLLGKNSDPVDCLAVLLGNVSSNALKSGTLQLTPEKLDNDVGSVIESLRLRIKEKKVVIIWDLLNINTEALKAFHNLCDRINPLVDEVIYIITIIANNYDESSSPLKFIENELHKKMTGKIKDDAIQPLITRITDGPILTVKPEPALTDCPLPKVSY